MKKLLFLAFFLICTVLTAQRNKYALAENYFRNNEFEKAMVLYKTLVKKSPYNTTYLSRLVSCYQESGNFQKAEDFLTTMLQNRPKLSYVNVLLGYNYERQQQQQKAQKYYNKAISSINENSSYGGTIANMFKKYSKLDLAIKAYQETAKTNKNANYGFQIAQIYGEKGDFEQMFEEYINYIDKNEKFLKIVKRYAARYITDDSENENNVLFKKALLRRSASNPKNEWNDLLSWLFTKQKDYGKAFIQHKALYARDPDNLSGIKQLGNIAFENKDYEIAKQCFDFFIAKTNYPKDKFRAVSMNLRIAVDTKDPDIEKKFQEVFKEYGINFNTIHAQLVYADFLTFTKDDPQKAKEVLEKALSLTKSKYLKAHIKLKIGDILVYQGKFNKALIYFSQVQTKLKNHYLSNEARFKVAQTSYFKNDFKWAKAQLKVLKGSTSKLVANDAANLFLLISDNEPKDSISSGLAEYAKADLLAYQNKDEQALSVLDKVIQNFKGQSIEDEALFKQAELYVKNKKYDAAISNFAKIIAIDKEGILVDDVYYKMAEMYNNELENSEKAKEYYQKIIFDYPSSIYLVDARKKFRKIRGDNI